MCYCGRSVNAGYIISCILLLRDCLIIMRCEALISDSQIDSALAYRIVEIIVFLHLLLLLLLCYGVYKRLLPIISFWLIVEMIYIIAFVGLFALSIYTTKDLLQRSEELGTTLTEQLQLVTTYVILAGNLAFNTSFWTIIYLLRRKYVELLARDDVSV